MAVLILIVVVFLIGWFAVDWLNEFAETKTLFLRLTKNSKSKPYRNLKRDSSSAYDVLYTLDKIDRAKKSKYYPASLLGAQENLLWNWVEDNFELELTRNMFDDIRLHFEPKPEVTTWMVEDFISTISKPIDHQIAWIKQMDDSDIELGRVELIKRNKKREEILNSMMVDFEEMYKTEDKEVRY